MKKGIVGKKIGMTQLFDQNGNVVPVTVIEAGPCVVSQKKTAENDGYDAVQIGYGDMKASKVTKPMKGHFAKGDVAPKKVLRELRVEDTAALNVGDILKADIFAEGETVDVHGTSKGKGYAGTIKRWNFARLKDVRTIEAKKIGLASQQTGAGRATKEDDIDLSAGIMVCKKIADEVQEGDVLARFFGNDEKKLQQAMLIAEEAFVIENEPCQPPQLIKRIIGI